MMMSNLKINDQKVFKQMFKSFKAQGLDVSLPYFGLFDLQGYIKETIYLAWSGSVEDGRKIKEVIELFGYTVDWDGDRARCIGVNPVPKSELAIR